MLSLAAGAVAVSEPHGIANAEQVRFIIEQVVDVVDSRREREQARTGERLNDLGERVALLEAAERLANELRIARDREIRDVKKTVEGMATQVGGMDTKIDSLVVDKAGRDTAISLAKWLVGTGFLGVVGSVIIATLHYIGVLRPPG